MGLSRYCRELAESIIGRGRRAVIKVGPLGQDIDVRRSHRRCVGFALIGILAGACSSRDDGSPAAATGPSSDPPIDDCASALLGCAPPPPRSFAPKPTPLRRLTSAEYRNTVSDLLNTSIQPDDLEPDTEVDGFAAVGASLTAASARGVEQYAAAAQAAAHRALSDTGDRNQLVGCAPAAPSDEACAASFISRFGQKVFRRPLTDEENGRYLGLFTSAVAVVADFYGSLEYPLSALLQSPYFLYRAEIGEADPLDETRRRLDPYELATRLSYFLSNTTPDDELLASAATGEISSDGGLKREVARLLLSPKAKQAVGTFFGEWLQLSRLDNLAQLPAFFPQATPTLGPSARREMLALIDDFAFAREADYRELFQTRVGFVDDALGALYGISAAKGGELVRTTLGAERAGFFARAAFLAQNGHASSASPTRRGKFVREVILCEVIAPPPPNVNVALPVDAPTPEPRTLRERLATHAINPVCASCHASLDPLGLGLEEFDGIGAYRTTEAGRPIDNRGQIDGIPFAGAAALGQIVADQPNLGACLVRNLLRYAIGRVESDGDTLVLAALATSFTAHHRRLTDLLTESVLSASFRYTGLPQ